jgi:hypothetical protein
MSNSTSIEGVHEAQKDDTGLLRQLLVKCQVLAFSNKVVAHPNHMINVNKN